MFTYQGRSRFVIVSGTSPIVDITARHSADVLAGAPRPRLREAEGERPRLRKSLGAICPHTHRAAHDVERPALSAAIALPNQRHDGEAPRASGEDV